MINFRYKGAFIIIQNINVDYLYYYIILINIILQYTNIYFFTLFLFPVFLRKDKLITATHACKLSLHSQCIGYDKIRCRLDGISESK